MMISLFTEPDSRISPERLRECTMSAPFEESVEAFHERLANFSIDTNDICFIPDESFSIIGTERYMNDIYGFVLFDDSKPDSHVERNTRQYKYHHLSFIGLDRRLFNNGWVKETLHTIFNKIIKYDSVKDKSIVDVVWLDKDGLIYSKEMKKHFNIYDNMFEEESEYFSNIIVPKENTPE